jgi:hypothetical protein
MDGVDLPSNPFFPSFIWEAGCCGAALQAFLEANLPQIPCPKGHENRAVYNGELCQKSSLIFRLALAWH